ncbi:hypothetical protein B0H63DRAFT_564055 [Podospora didyma]|uniref:Heterokaryon incompatibility protein n=1 Tax=Podospora didyma TaxID=330526 RepID=A0AAE0KB55_9PEZI|nr:hypothetical protein B0H63DRAFT_564055 [Podospora didyma]
MSRLSFNPDELIPGALKFEPGSPTPIEREFVTAKITPDELETSSNFSLAAFGSGGHGRSRKCYQLGKPAFSIVRKVYDRVSFAKDPNRPRRSIEEDSNIYRAREATDPRDKIYGLLANAPSTKDGIEPIVPDYSSTVQALYIKVAVFGLLNTPGWGMLSLVGDRTENNIPMLPSWPPDYTQRMPWQEIRASDFIEFRTTTTSPDHTTNIIHDFKNNPQEAAYAHDPNLAKLMTVPESVDMTEILEDNAGFDGDDSITSEVNVLEEEEEQEQDEEDRIEDERVDTWLQAMYSATMEARIDWDMSSENRCLFRTQGGLLGIGPQTAQVGDQVGILQGARVPYLFRQPEPGPENSLEFVGESYVYGIMYGELEA